MATGLRPVAGGAPAYPGDTQSASQPADGFTRGHDGDAFDISEGQHVTLVAGHEQFGIARDRPRQYRIVLGVPRRVHLRQRGDHHTHRFNLDRPAKARALAFLRGECGAGALCDLVSLELRDRCKHGETEPPDR